MIVRRISDWPRWGWRSPFEELDRLRRQMDDLFVDLTGGTLRAPSAGVFPMVNVTEDRDAYYVRAELPEVKAGDLDISVTGTSVTVSGERKIPSPNESATYHRREREGGHFSRVIGLPRQVDPGKVEAHSGDGILTIVLPKIEETKPKQITVKAL